MNSIMLCELRKQNRSCEAINEPQVKKLFDLIHCLYRISVLSRKDDLLALEYAVDELAEDQLQDTLLSYLKMLVEMIVDGMDPELTEEAGLNTYFATDPEETEGLGYLLILRGCLAIQSGENPRAILLLLRSMLNPELQSQFDSAKEQWETADLEKEMEQGKLLIERFSSQKLLFPIKAISYRDVCLLDQLLSDMDDKDIQRILRDIDFHEVSCYVPALSGEANRRIFSNLSSRVSILIAQDAQNEHKSMDKIAEAVGKTLGVIYRLASAGEINLVNTVNTLRQHIEQGEKSVKEESLC